MSVKTRFAPSPTGYLHIGGARTALFSWLYARHTGGSFLLRIEDTDRERSTQASVDAILQGMAWLGLDYDEGPYYQTQRMDRYRECIQQLLDQGDAYHCYCTKDELEAMRAEQMARKEKPRYDGRCRQRKSPPAVGVDPVIRFKSPREGMTTVEDRVHGTVEFNNAELDDLIIARPDGSPTYNFTVCVDDMDMGITDVIRGDDHLNNTPRQLQILKALGGKAPRYAHVPMILGPDGKRLSKRHDAVSVMQYKEEGFLPEALLNYLVRLGWSHGDDEVFTKEQMVELFDIVDANKSAATFNRDKLVWLNQHYFKCSAPSHVATALKPHMESMGLDLAQGPSLERLVEVQRERAKTLVEMAEDSRVYYEEFEQYVEKDAQKHLSTESVPVLHALLNALESLPEWQGEALHACIKAVAVETETKLGKVAQPLRVALCGRASSPSIDLTLELVGRARSLSRLRRAIDFASGA